MKIKNRLSLYFTLISCGALLLVLLTLYLAVFGFLKTDFNKRLADRVNIASQVYLEADEIGADSLVEIQQRYLEKLPEEVIRVYNDKNKASFNASNGIYWNNDIINQVRKTGAIEYEEGQRQVVGKYYHDNQGNFVILGSAVDRNFKARVLMLGRIALILFGAFSIILFFVGRWFAQNMLAPIQNVVEQMRRIGSSNLHLRIQETRNKDEVAELVSNFNSLLQRLEDAFELQKSFVSNASHELRTPLTSIMGEADVALEKPRDTWEYERVLRSISADAMQLQQTITSLMELARADFAYSQQALQPVRIDELLWEIQDYWQHKKGADMLHLLFGNFPEDEQKLIIQGSKPLLYIALNNIIDNAFKYSAGEPVTVSFEAEGEHIQLTVTDSGPGINSQEAELIFKPFYRAASTRSVAGSGVGLYIAGKILQLCNSSIQVISDGVSGSSFIITFRPSVQQQP
jgi:signal transduction histidine kinase